LTKIFVIVNEDLRHSRQSGHVAAFACSSGALWAQRTQVASAAAAQVRIAYRD
jgi:hypothetical protein